MTADGLTKLSFLHSNRKNADGITRSKQKLLPENLYSFFVVVFFLYFITLIYRASQFTGSEILTYSIDGYWLITTDAAARLSLLICNIGFDKATSRHYVLYTANVTKLVHLQSDLRNIQLNNMKKALAKVWRKVFLVLECVSNERI